MNRRTALLAMALTGALSARGQTPSEPQIVLSIFGGLAGGTGLWEVNRQPLLVLSNSGLPSVLDVYDTLRVRRDLRSGFVAGVNATYFASSHVGIVGEISLLGLGLEDRCEMIAENANADPQQRNRQVCNDIEGRTGAASSVAFFVGAIARTSPGPVVPYVRLQGGFTTRQSSMTELSGRFLNPVTGGAITRGIYLDPAGGRVDPAASFGVGLMAQVSTGYQFRIELRDHVIRAREVTGPSTLASPGLPPVSSRFIHNLALLVHFDVVLERKRGRRY